MNGRMAALVRRLWFVVALVGMASAAAATPSVTGVRVGEHPAMTRLVLDLNEPVEYRVFTLANPYRVVIDLPETEWQVRPGLKASAGLIRGLRYGLFRPGVSRVVLDVDKPVVVHRAFLLEPNGSYGFRFVLDLKAVAPEAFQQTARLAPPPPAAAPVSPKGPRRRPDGKRVVVIDPGHGGVDPGTVGRTGTPEKAVTLAIAREVKKALAATGRYHPVLTRERDVFVRLRDRVEKARKENAELFVSLHADYIANKRLRGASVYTLSEKASDAEAALLATKENKADIIAGVDFNGQSKEVANILIDLAQRETMNASARFANLLLPELAQRTRVLRKSHRFAGFAVLKAPDVPSVLLEMGYLSNIEDERLLRSVTKRQGLVAAIVAAIDAYFAAQGG